MTPNAVTRTLARDKHACRHFDATGPVTRNRRDENHSAPAGDICHFAAGIDRRREPDPPDRRRGRSGLPAAGNLAGVAPASRGPRPDLRRGRSDERRAAGGRVSGVHQRAELPAARRAVAALQGPARRAAFAISSETPIAFETAPRFFEGRCGVCDAALHIAICGEISPPTRGPSRNVTGIRARRCSRTTETGTHRAGGPRDRSAAPEGTPGAARFFITEEVRCCRPRQA